MGDLTPLLSLRKVVEKATSERCRIQQQIESYRAEILEGQNTLRELEFTIQEYERAIDLLEFAHEK
jgi:hypothetical protein